MEPAVMTASIVSKEMFCSLALNFERLEVVTPGVHLLSSCMHHLFFLFYFVKQKLSLQES